MKEKMIRYQWLLPAVLVFILGGCSENGQSDAYGQFETTSTLISSKIGGELLAFSPSEGSTLEAGLPVATIDTTMLNLRKQELQAQLQSVQSRTGNINAEIEVQKEQLEIAQTNLNRLQRLAEDNAATQQQLDDAQGNVRTIQKRIDALETQKQSIRAEINATKVRIKQLEQQLKDAHVINPVTGTVLNTYVEPHEMIGEGQPLYQIANLDTMELRVYVSGAQLPMVKLGQEVEVLVDKNETENQRYSGRVSWIASNAEFTPQMIQTKEERVTQVYAVKVKVPNPDGVLKIGMPGEVNFN